MSAVKVLYRIGKYRIYKVVGLYPVVDWGGAIVATEKTLESAKSIAIALDTGMKRL